MPDIILLIILYPFLFILYYFLNGTCYAQTETCFHVVIPKWLWKDDRLHSILKTYQRRVRRNIIISAATSLVVVIIPSPSISITLLYVWVLFTIVAAFLPFGQANLEVRYLLIQLRYAEEASCIPVVPPTDSKWTPWNVKFPMLIKMILGCYPIMYILYHLPAGRNVSNIMILILPLNLLNLFFLYHREKQEYSNPIPICMDQEINQTFIRIKQRGLRICFAILVDTNIISIYIIFFYFQYLIDYHLLFLFATYLYLFFCRCLVIHCSKIIFQKQQKLITNSNIGPEYSAYNNNWVCGLFYYNPGDRRILVRSNFIIGFSINYARRLGKFLHSIGSFFLISGLFICIWACFLEFTPLNLSIEDNQIIATQLRDEYFISIQEIEILRLLEEKPIELVHNSFSSVSKGSFTVDRYGKCTLFIHPANTYYIYLQTTKQKQYILSSYDDQATLSFYDQIRDLVYD